MVFVGNKADLESDIELDIEEIGSLAGKYKSSHIMTSAKTGQNVHAMFHELSLAMLEVRVGDENEPFDEKNGLYSQKPPPAQASIIR